MRRVLISITTAVSISALCLINLSCAGDTQSGGSSLRVDSFLAAYSGKSDSSYNIQPGSKEAAGILALVNAASYETFDKSAGVSLDKRAAANIVERREESEIETLQQLDSIPWVGKRAFRKLYEYAEENGYFETDGDPEDPEDSEERPPAVKLSLGKEKENFIDSLAVDPEGRIYVTGATTELRQTIGRTEPPEADTKRVYLAAASADGEIDWIRTFDTSSKDLAVEADESGVYLLYNSESSGGNQLVKYSPEGLQRLWDTNVARNHELTGGNLVLEAGTIVATIEYAVGSRKRERNIVSVAYNSENGSRKWDFNRRNSNSDDLAFVDGHPVFVDDRGGRRFTLVRWNPATNEQLWRKTLVDGSEWHVQVASSDDGELFTVGRDSGDVRLFKLTADGESKWKYEFQRGITEIKGVRVQGEAVYVVVRVDEKLAEQSGGDGEHDVVVYRFKDRLREPALQNIEALPAEDTTDGDIESFDIHGGQIYAGWRSWALTGWEVIVKSFPLPGISDDAPIEFPELGLADWADLVGETAHLEGTCHVRIRSIENESETCFGGHPEKTYSELATAKAHVLSSDPFEMQFESITGVDTERTVTFESSDPRTIKWSENRTTLTISGETLSTEYRRTHHSTASCEDRRTYRSCTYDLTR
jgi:DNA uptake protein ComE-like DNA-binding protein